MLFQLAGGPQASSIVDDLPLQWSDYGQNNTIILVDLPRGDHQMLNELVDPEGSVPTSQSVPFKSPGNNACPRHLEKGICHEAQRQANDWDSHGGARRP